MRPSRPEADQGIHERPSPASGHRVVPHTADVIVEAWAASRPECMEEAVRALVDSFALVTASVTNPVPVVFDERDDEALLLAVLDEVIYVIDVLGAVPANVVLDETEDGRLVGFMDLAPLSAVEVHGSLPKGVSLSELGVGRDERGWRCRATIDV
jgi:SHS2 domain-containing protein